MNLLERISRMLRANVNSSLDRSENPEQLLDQMLRDMHMAIGEAQAQHAELIRIAQGLEAEKQKYIRQARDLGGQAERAVATGRDDLARDLLARKRQAEIAAADYTAQWENQNALVLQFQRQLTELTRKYEDMGRNRHILLTRERTAIAQQRMAQLMQNMQTIDPSTPAGQIESRVRRLEYQTAAEAEVNNMNRSLEQQMAELEAQERADAQFQAMRERHAVPPANLSAPQQFQYRPGVPNPPQPNQLPKPREMWFADSTPATPPAPPKPKDLWFEGSEPPTPAMPPKPIDLWFDENAPATPPAPAKPQDLWFEESEVAPAPNNTSQNQPKEVWFDDSEVAPAQTKSDAPQNNAKKVWFDNEIATPLASPRKQLAWFEEEDEEPEDNPPVPVEQKSVWFDEPQAATPEKPPEPEPRSVWFDEDEKKSKD